MGIPPPLIPLFHSYQILMKSFALLFAEVTKISWKMVQVAMQVMNFNAHVAAELIKRSQHGLHKYLVVLISVISEKVICNSHI